MTAKRYAPARDVACEAPGRPVCSCSGTLRPGRWGTAHIWGGPEWCIHYEPDFDPPGIACCDSARATGGEYHAPGCLEPRP